MERQKSNITELENLTKWKNFTDSFYKDEQVKTYALLYASNKCYLGLVDKEGNIDVRDDKYFDIKKVFEARIFNKNAEFRWLKGFDEKVISDVDFTTDDNFLKPLKQKYLIWGEKIKDATNSTGWTQFGTARIGTFYVPIEVEKVQNYAQFEAVEYLKEYADGNIAVCDERLTGICSYLTSCGGNKDANK